MCQCGKSQYDFCNECGETSKYNYYYAEPCASCGDDTPKCTKTIDAQCVINNRDLDFLGVSAEDKIDVQVLLMSIDNALKSISNMSCVEFTRKIDSTTGVASYEHSLDFGCMADFICPLCNEE